jgi:hypothetical protein
MPEIDPVVEVLRQIAADCIETGTTVALTNGSFSEDHGVALEVYLYDKDDPHRVGLAGYASELLDAVIEDLAVHVPGCAVDLRQTRRWLTQHLELEPTELGEE